MESDAYKRYIEVHPEHIHSVILRMQTFSPRDRPTTSDTPARTFAAAHFPRPQWTADWRIGRAGQGAESPVWPLGRPPSQWPPRVVPSEAASLRSRTSYPAPSLRHFLGR